MTTRAVTRVCPLCESTCGLTITIDGDRVMEVRGNENDAFSKGYLCPKGANLGALDEDPDRLTQPLVRRDGKLVRASWSEAFETIDRGLASVRERFGADSVALYSGNPTAHSFASPYLKYLIRALDSPNMYSASTADQVPTQVACAAVFGSVNSVPVPDIDRTTHLLIIGANPVESNGSLITAPDMPGRLRALRERGGTLTVVDPRRTRTAELADRHMPVRPGTDAYLLFAVVYTLFAERLVRLGEHARIVTGIQELEKLAAHFAPEVVADLCGVPAESIRLVARELAAAPAAAVYGRMGTCTADFATVTNWLIQSLNVLTGNLDRPGGVMFPRSPVRPAYVSDRPFRMGRRHSRVRGLSEILGEFPVATLADEIDTDGPGQIQALFTVAGNPVLSAPNGARLAQSLSRLEFMVSVDVYVNETTSHADVILPPPRILESGHFDWMLSGFFVQGVTRYSRPALKQSDERPNEAEILAKLTLIAQGHGADANPANLLESLLMDLLLKAVAAPGSPVEGRDPQELRDRLTGETDNERYFEVMVRLGPYGDGFGARPDGLTVSKLLANPGGVDHGAMVPRIEEVLVHPNGVIDLCPDLVRPEITRLLAGKMRERPDLVLIGRRKLRSKNSWLHNVPNLVSGPELCTLQMNEVDADRLGIGDGEMVKVISNVGELTVPVETTRVVRPGVVSLPHGWGHDLIGSRLDVAAVAPGVSANALTDESTIDPLSGNAIFNGVPVQVVAVQTADMPPSTVSVAPVT